MRTFTAQLVIHPQLADRQLSISACVYQLVPACACILWLVSLHFSFFLLAKTMLSLIINCFHWTRAIQVFDDWFILPVNRNSYCS